MDWLENLKPKTSWLLWSWLYKGNQIRISSLLSLVVFVFSVCKVMWPYPSITYGDRAFLNGRRAKQKWCNIQLYSFYWIVFFLFVSYVLVFFQIFFLSYYLPKLLSHPRFYFISDIWNLLIWPFSCLSSQLTYYNLCPVSSYFCVFLKTLYSNIFLYICHIFFNVVLLNFLWIYLNKLIHTDKEHLQKV